MGAQGTSFLPSRGPLSLPLFPWRDRLVYPSIAWPVLGAARVAGLPCSQRTSGQAGNHGELPPSLLEVHGPRAWHTWQASLSPGQRQSWHELKKIITLRGHLVTTSHLPMTQEWDKGQTGGLDPSSSRKTLRASHCLPPRLRHPKGSPTQLAQL